MVRVWILGRNMERLLSEETQKERHRREETQKERHRSEATKTVSVRHYSGGTGRATNHLKGRAHSEANSPRPCLAASGETEFWSCPERRARVSGVPAVGDPMQPVPGHVRVSG